MPKLYATYTRPKKKVQTKHNSLPPTFQTSVPDSSIFFTVFQAFSVVSLQCFLQNPPSALHRFSKTKRLLLRGGHQLNPVITLLVSFAFYALTLFLHLALRGYRDLWKGYDSGRWICVSRSVCFCISILLVFLALLLS